MSESKGCIYILTNPSFPKFVKIGYADDVYKRLNQLNRSECIPYAFRLYAYYEVSARLTDIKLHQMIDKLNPNLRSIEDFNGKKRVREFYAMDAEKAYSILETIAELNGMQENLHLVEPTIEETDAEIEAAEITGMPINRHHFKECTFKSSLTGKWYQGKTSDTGVLSIIDIQTNVEVPNNSNPSKKSIIARAIIDMGGTCTKDETLYQLYRKLSKMELPENVRDTNDVIIEKSVSSNDVRVFILRVPNEVKKYLNSDESTLRLQLGTLEPMDYKYNSNGRFVSGVSKFYKESGFKRDITENDAQKVIWTINGNNIKVTKK